MTTQPDQAQPIRSVDQLVADYLDINDKIQALTGQADTIKAALRDLGIGRHATTSGIPVVVTAPARRFNIDRAWTMLTPDQQYLAVGPVAAKVKAQLAPVLLDQCMDPGAGEPTVRIG